MKTRRFLPEAIAFLAAAVVCAAISNAVAGPERKLKWVGSYAEPAAGTRPTPPVGVSTGAPAPATATTAPAAPTAPTASAGAPAAPPGAAAGGATTFAPHPDKAWVEISGEDAAALHTKGIPFIDARRTSVYRQGHIAGARCIAVWESDVDQKVQAIFQEGLDQRAPIVVYCSGGDCEDSHMLSQKLYFVGFDNVLVYKDGFPDWQKRGLPVHTGDAP